MRAAQPGLEGGARVWVPVRTAAWDELTSACARAKIRTRGPGGQLQPDPSQGRGNPVSAKNLPAATRSTRSRHLPLLPARHRPRLRPRLFGGGVPGRSSSSWAGPSQDKVSCREVPGHPSSIWAALSRHRGFRWAGLWTPFQWAGLSRPVAPAGRDGQSYSRASAESRLAQRWLLT